jgi:hypothetical protein
MPKNNKKPGEGLTLAQMREKLLAAGKITSEGLAVARAELAADPEWHVFVAQQPQTLNK